LRQQETIFFHEQLYRTDVVMAKLKEFLSLFVAQELWVQTWLRIWFVRVLANLN